MTREAADDVIQARLKTWASRHPLVSSQRFDGPLEIDRSHADGMRCQVERMSETRTDEERMVADVPGNRPSRAINDASFVVEPPAEMVDASFTYYIEGTLRTNRCPQCGGEGKKQCPACRGIGTTNCRSCGGLGT